jgi:uncharacterized protein YbcC (UPF0753/DUF2309 family)
MNGALAEVSSPDRRASEVALETVPGTQTGFSRVLEEALEHVGHILPDQAPLEFFVHHNTLHAYEDLPFEEAVEVAAKELGAEPWLPEDEYRACLKTGRILPEEVVEVIASCESSQRLEEEVLPGKSRASLRKDILLLGLEELEGAALRWKLSCEKASTRLRRSVARDVRRKGFAGTRVWLNEMAGRDDREGLEATLQISDASLGKPLEDELGFSPTPAEVRWALADDPEAVTTRALWTACLGRRQDFSVSRATGDDNEIHRPREELQRVIGVDCDKLVHPLLIRYLAAFLDQGVSYWSLPGREVGLYASILKLWELPNGIQQGWYAPLDQEVRDLLAEELGPEEVVEKILREFGASEAQVGNIVQATLLALPGWAGMVHRLHRRPDQAPRGCPPLSLTELLALILILDRRAARYVMARELNKKVDFEDLRDLPDAAPDSPDPAAKAYILFQLAQFSGLSARQVATCSREQLGALAQELEDFDNWTRRRHLHLAYEMRLERQTLDIVAFAYARADVKESAAPPPVQAFFCIDDREESIRRHLEEVRPDFETFGAAGFYSIPMAFQAFDHAHAFPLCPVAVTPSNQVEERLEEAGKILPGFFVRFFGSLELEAGSVVTGWLASVLLGFTQIFPLILRIFAPRLAARIRHFLHHLAFGRGTARLTARSEDGIRNAHGVLLGFDLEQRIESVARVLEDAGLIKGFSPIVLILGHGSTTRNNPHEAAHCCGACSGKDGGPNARLFADFANEPAVRKALQERGIVIPDQCHFLGGSHDTASDRIELFDLDQVPESHRELLGDLRVALDEARARDAHERIRRFGTAPRGGGTQEALRYVEGRAERLDEPRPEYGHATNAISFVGRRTWSKGVFLDRRAFLTSYDPESDPDASILERSFASVGPVGAGINLEYFFSRVDSQRYGAGTKLPHNIACLVGVVNGHSGDLQTGLPLEMVDIHEPVRLINVIEASPEVLTRVLDHLPGVARLVRNRWMIVTALDPETGKIWRYRDGGFELYHPRSTPPVAPSSRAWYSGSADHLPFAMISTDSSKDSCGPEEATRG